MIRNYLLTIGSCILISCNDNSIDNSGAGIEDVNTIIREADSVNQALQADSISRKDSIMRNKKKAGRKKPLKARERTIT